MRLIAVGVLALLVAACGSGGGPVGVELDEFSISVSRETAEAGHVEFHVRNVGEIPHTFLILRTDLAPDDLPVRDAEVDLEAGGMDVVADARDQLEPGQDVTVALAATLDGGAHVLVCNVPGHYQSGMRTPLRVTAAP